MKAIIDAQKQFFQSQKTRSVSWRLDQLRKLYHAIEHYEPDLITAFKKDLSKSSFEVYMTEIGIVKRSIRFHMKHLRRWNKPKRVRTPVFLFGKTSRIHTIPRGTVLIIGPFNYPFQLILEPLIAAISAGNTIILKPSEMVPNVSSVIESMLSTIFEPEYVKVIQGDAQTTQNLLNHAFDLIFFTGSANVAKSIYSRAAEHLTPVILELGGKSPAVVLKDADIDKAAKRIVWGKFINTGQTCVAPDYVFVENAIKNAFVDKVKETILDFYGEHIQQNPDYGRIVNERHALRLKSIIQAHSDDVVMGGHVEETYVAPTVIVLDEPRGKVMESEIFGPILPIIPFDNLDTCISYIESKPHPLAFYVFSRNLKNAKTLFNRIHCGGGAINDTIYQVSNEHLPFGGVGYSGIGSYHGYHGFIAFSHQKAQVISTTRFDISLMYPPYGSKIDVLRKIIK